MSGNEQKTLLSSGVADKTGTGLDISCPMGKISGDIISRAQIEDLQNGLFFELKTTGVNGEQQDVYKRQRESPSTNHRSSAMFSTAETARNASGATLLPTARRSEAK